MILPFFVFVDVWSASCVCMGHHTIAMATTHTQTYSTSHIYPIVVFNNGEKKLFFFAGQQLFFFSQR